MCEKMRHTNGDVLELIELVDERPDDGHVDSHIGELLVTEIILHDADDVASDAVNGSVDGQMAVGVGPAAVYRVAILAVVSVQPAQQRPLLVVWGCGQHDAPLTAGHAG